MNINRLFYSQNWNIGFCIMTAEQFVDKKTLNSVKWLKHSYKDRWFADPFILSVTPNEIVVLAEECSIENPRGIIVELHIDRISMQLERRYVLLELETHLSYPFIVTEENRIYVCPENGESKQWFRYEYNSDRHSLVNPIKIYDGAIADASILEYMGYKYMIASKFPNTQENAYLFRKGENGMYHQLSDGAVSTGLVSRPGGGWIIAKSKLYRPVQNCTKNYGGSLMIRECTVKGDSFSENDSFELKPIDRKYSLGLHTINFMDNLCVIDGCGYLYPFWGKLYEVLRSIKRKIV